MKHIDPYADIQKTPLFTADRMKSGGYSIRLHDNRVTGGWREVGLVSEKYLLVSNEKVRDLALEIASKSPFDWNLDNTYFDGRRFALSFYAEDAEQIEVKENDPVGLGFMVENSYDGSRPLRAMIYAFRLRCKNGLICRELFSSLRLKHEPQSKGWARELRRMLHLIVSGEKNLQRFARTARKLSLIEFGSEELRQARCGPLASLPISLWARSIDRYLLHEEHTGWGLLNATTNVLWHEGTSLTQRLDRNDQTVSGLLQFANDAYELRSEVETSPPRPPELSTSSK